MRLAPSKLTNIGASMFHPDGPTFVELCRQALSSTRVGYDMLAPKFDHTPFRTPDAVIEKALDVAADARVGASLDLCTGTGAALPLLLRRTSDRLVGVDFSAGMLAEARARLGLTVASEAPRVELIESDVFAYEAPDAFDLVTCFGAFGHVPVESEPRFVDRVRSLLRPGGAFVFVTGDRPPALAPRALVARAFNGVMRARNAFLPGAFIMYYLTFMLPEVERLLAWRGFSVTLHRGCFEGAFAPLVVVRATRT